MYRALACADPIEIGASSSRLPPAHAAGLSAPPVVGRFAGLPAGALEPFGSASCGGLLEARGPVEEELAAAREALVEAIEGALTGFDAAARRLLLAVKRSCFNGREIGKYRSRPEWPEVLRVAGGLAGRVTALEERLAASDAALAGLHRSELTRERHHLLGLIEDRRFLRGVAVGTPGLVRKVRSQAPALIASGFARAPAKWEESLLRFATRAAAKLSANSTLTSYALGSLREAPSAGALRFGGAAPREVSLVRLDRPQLEQFQALLIGHPAVRSRSLVAWNDSVEEIEPGRYRYLRDSHWRLEPGAEQFEYIKPARIKISLSPPLLDAAREALRGGPLPYDALPAALEERWTPAAGDPADARGALEQLLDLRVLVLLPPWPTHEPRLERRIGRFLRSLPDDDPVLRAIAGALDELLALEEAFASAARPERSVVAMEGAFARLIRAAAPVAGHDGDVAVRAHVFEDVLIEPGAGAGDDRGVFEIAAPAAGEILETAALLSQFDALFNLRHDVLHTLARWWREQQPGRREIPFTELARGFSPLWKEFLAFYETGRTSALASFDPLSSPALATLREARAALLSRTAELVAGTPSKDRLPVPEFAALVGSLPRRYAPQVGSSAFVQPADAEGSSWVLNNLTEGTGRYLSRIVPSLDGDLRERFLDHLAARSTVVIDGEEADLLEVKHPWIHLVRAHPPQAARVLDFRGLHLDLPPERRLHLRDLTVQADLDAETFRLVDPAGRRVLPASLSTISDSGLPNLLRLLLMFGPGETRGVFPASYAEVGGDVTEFGRLSCGRLVIRRRAWQIGVAGVRGPLADLDDLRAYVEVDRWRRRLGLPAAGYYRELTYRGKNKPQYLRFDSPSLCRLFVSSLRKMETDSFHFVEALPAPESYPFDVSMERRAFELLIDSLAIRDPGGTPSVRAADRDIERTPLRKEHRDGQGPEPGDRGPVGRRSRVGERRPRQDVGRRHL